MKSKNQSYKESLILSKNNFDFDKDLLSKITKQINFNNPRLRKIDSLLTGAFQSTKYGVGFDFNEIREYKIGDDLRHISWTHTAKAGKLQTKEFYAEKELRVCLIVDLSHSMYCGSKMETLLKSLAYILNIIKGHCEKIGGIVFSGEIKYHFPQREIKSGSSIIFETIVKDYFSFLESNPKFGKINISEITNFSNQILKKRGLVFFLSDFLNMENLERSLFELSKIQNVYLLQIFELIDFNFDKNGFMYVFDPETNKKVIVNTDSTVLNQAFKDSMDQFQKKLESLSNKFGIKHILLKKEDFR